MNWQDLVVAHGSEATLLVASNTIKELCSIYQVCAGLESVIEGDIQKKRKLMLSNIMDDLRPHS
jgi:hypothetical protein